MEQRDTFDKEGIVINKSNYVPEIKKILLIKKNFVGEFIKIHQFIQQKKLMGKERIYWQEKVLNLN